MDFRNPQRGSGLRRNSTSATAKLIRAQAQTVDAHVGQKIRERRNEQGLKQTEVADALGVTFQQVQKYERGTNRVGASRLFDLSRILEVKIQHFFEGLENQASNPNNNMENHLHLIEPTTIELVEAYYKVNNPHIRRNILSTIRFIASGH